MSFSEDLKAISTAENLSDKNIKKNIKNILNNFTEVLENPEFFKLEFSKLRFLFSKYCDIFSDQGTDDYEVDDKEQAIKNITTFCASAYSGLSKTENISPRNSSKKSININTAKKKKLNILLIASGVVSSLYFL